MFLILLLALVILFLLLDYLVQRHYEGFCTVLLYLVWSCLAVIFKGYVLSKGKWKRSIAGRERKRREAGKSAGTSNWVGIQFMREEYIFNKKEMAFVT